MSDAMHRNDEAEPNEVAAPETHWRAAVAAIREMPKGTVIALADFEEWFGVPFDSRLWAFQWMPMRDALLWDHDIALSRVPGVGYEVSSDEQMVREHMERAWNQIMSGVRRLGKFSAIVDTSKLTPESAAVFDRKVLQTGFLASALGQMKKKIAAASADEKTSMRRIAAEVD